MAVLTKGLPVVFIPEKRMITAMGDDMINYCRGRQHTAFQTFGAQWMPGQKRLSRFSPVCVITTGSRSAAQTI